MLTAVLYDLWTALRRAQLRKRAIAELSALDDRLLRDIGLRRAEVKGTVDGTLRTQETAQSDRPDVPVRAQCAPAAACD